MLRTFSLVVALVAGPASAQPAPPTHPIELELQRCTEAAGSVDAAMGDCAGQAMDAWDADMNATYAKLMDALEPEQREALREAQRRWLAFRDAEFEAIGAMHANGGTLDSLMARSASMEVVRQRALDLAHHLHYVTM